MKIAIIAMATFVAVLVVQWLRVRRFNRRFDRALERARWWSR